MVLLLVGCSKKKMSAEQYEHYIRSTESGLVRSAGQGELLMTLQYQPGSTSEHRFFLFFSDVNKARSATALAGNDLEAKTMLYQYFDIEAASQIRLIQDGDTLLPRHYHYERTYDLAPYDCISMSFPAKEDSRGDLIFYFNENILGFGPQRWTFNLHDIERANQIEIEKK